MRHHIAVLIIAALLAPAGAAAHSSPLQDAYRRAVHYLGTAPCHGRVSIRLVNPNREVREAEAEYGQRGSVLSWTEPESCWVAFNRRAWPTRRVMRRQFPLLCVAMIHELGSALGLPESEVEHRTTDVRDAYLNEIIPPRVCQSVR